MATLEVMRPLAAPRKTGCFCDASNTDNVKPDYGLLGSYGDNGEKNVTFLLNVPWGGTTVATVPLLELPLLTTVEIQRLSYAAMKKQEPLHSLPSSTRLAASAVDLYLPGSFLVSLAAARAGLGETAVATSKLRLVLQQQEIYATSFVPLEKVIGASAAAAVATARGDAAAATGVPVKEEEVSRGAPLCSLWLLLRLRGGKGGFGALLKKQRRKKRANFSIDACRDLTGRRIRQAQVVTRIKAWMEKKRKEDALVGVLAQDAREKLPEAKPAVSLDAAFISQQVAQTSEMPDLVAHGLKHQAALREEQEAERRTRATAPQNAAIFAQLRDAVELDSESDHWSDIDADEIPKGAEQNSGHSSSGSYSSTRPICKSTGADRSTRAGSASSSSSKARTDVGSSSRKSNFPARPAKPDAAAQAMMQQLEEMRLQAAAANAAERERKAAAAAELAKAAEEAEKFAAAEAQRVAREAQQLDVSRFSTAEELARAVDEAVVKEKLKQLGWKCGGRPEERAARLLQLKTVDLANVPKVLLARQPVRMA